MKKTEKTENIEEIEEVKVKKAKKKEEKENIAQEETKEQDKVKEIIEKAKSKGQITYGELASQLDEANSEQIDKVFDAFEEIGVDILQEDLEEPDIEDLEDVEFYTFLSNSEIPKCAFETDSEKYSYYIFPDATVLCSCRECIEALDD